MNFLRFPDAKTWIAAVTEAGFITDDTLTAYTHDRAIDVVGGIPDVDGWHINYIGGLPDGWDEFLVSPNDPYRVFA